MDLATQHLVREFIWLPTRKIPEQLDINLLWDFLSEQGITPYFCHFDQRDNLFFWYRNFLSNIADYREADYKYSWWCLFCNLIFSTYPTIGKCSYSLYTVPEIGQYLSLCNQLAPLYVKINYVNPHRD